MAGRPPRLEQVFQKYVQPLYFVTFVTAGRARLLARDAVHETFRAYALQGVDRGVAVGRYVLMPDHVHLFVRGSFDFVLAQWVRLLKRRLSKAINEPLPHWQEGFFDHLMRGSESYAQKWDYVRENPVRAGLASNSEEWPYQGEIVCLSYE